MPSASEFSAKLLRSSSSAYAKATLHALQASHPRLIEKALPESFANPLDDIEVRLRQISASLTVDRPALLGDVLRWYRVAFHHRGVSNDYLPGTLQAIEEVLEREMPPESFAPVQRHLAEGSANLAEASVDLEPCVSLSAPHGEVSARFLLANLEGRGEDALDLIRAALRDGLSVEQIHEHVLLPSQREVGRMWLMAEIPIADEHYSSGIVERALWILQEQLQRPASDARVILTMGVGGNTHDLGMRMVGQRLQSGGFFVHHLGADMPASDLAWFLRDRSVDLIALSASMLMHMPSMCEVISVLRATMFDLHGDAHARPIMVGGPPFALVSDLHSIVGADASVPRASDAVTEAERLLPKA